MTKQKHAMQMGKLLTVGALLLCGTALLGGCGDKSSSGPPTADEKASFAGDPSKMPPGTMDKIKQAQQGGANRAPGAGAPAGR